MVVWVAEERVRFAHSQAVQSRRTARALCIATEVFLVLALELLGKVGNETVIEVLATKMGVTSCGFYFEDAFLNGKKRNIKCSTTRIEDEDVLLACDVLLIKAIGDNGSSRLVDDTKGL